MQKRGVFVDSDDFLPVTGTYPPHPISQYKPRFSTTGELLDHRAKAYHDDVKRKMDEFEKHQKVATVPVSRIPDEGYVISPRFTSIKQKSAELKRAARLKANLTDTVQDPKAEAGEPGLRWRNNPPFKTCSELMESRRV